MLLIFPGLHIPHKPNTFNIHHNHYYSPNYLMNSCIITVWKQILLIHIRIPWLEIILPMYSTGKKEACNIYRKNKVYAWHKSSLGFTLPALLLISSTGLLVNLPPEFGHYAFFFFLLLLVILRRSWPRTHPIFSAFAHMIVKKHEADRNLRE